MSSSERPRSMMVHEAVHEARLKTLMELYGVDSAHAEIMVQRQQVYGDPLENHENIAAMFSIILRPWALRLILGKPLPPHVVALCLCALKMTRQRLTYHKDNYADMHNYQQFAAVWQELWEEEKIGDGGKPWAIMPEALVTVAQQLEDSRAERMK